MQPLYVEPVHVDVAYPQLIGQIENNPNSKASHSLLPRRGGEGCGGGGLPNITTWYSF